MDDLQLEICSPEPMHFPGDIFEGACWPLLGQPQPGSLNPLDSGENCAFYVTQRRATRGRNPDIAASMYADSQVSNAFVRDRRVYAGCVDAILPQGEESFCEVHRRTQ